MMEPIAAVEAMLFVAEEPIPPGEIAEANTWATQAIAARSLRPCSNFQPTQPSATVESVKTIRSVCSLK